MSHVVNTVALANASQPKGQLPAGPAYVYGFGVLAVLVLVIVLWIMGAIREACERRRLRTASRELRKLWEELQQERRARAEPAHHSVPERYRKKP